jgi:phosphonate transport system substrate-binding protein
MKVIIATFCYIVFSSHTNSVWADEDVYSFGIVPQQSATRLAELWSPVLDYIGEQAGIKLQFQTAKDIPEFEKRLAAGAYDFAYMNPYHFVVFNRAPGYRAVAVRKNQPISGIIVVRKDSTIQSLADLSNKTLAFPSPAAFAASILPQAELRKKHIPFTPQYVSSHDSVYLGVARGLFPAGGGIERTFNKVPSDIKEQLTILWKTDAHTPHAIAAHPSIDNTTFEKIQRALVMMDKDTTGKMFLQSLEIKNGLKAAISEDWDDIRHLNITLINNSSN